MQVPGMWELNGYGDPVYKNVGYAWHGHYDTMPPVPADEHNYAGQYRRTFYIGEEWKGEDIFLHIGSATSNVRVWINGKGHSYKTVTANATCTEAGSVTKTCSACGDTQVTAIPATGHSYSTTVTPPTCEDFGYTTYTCTACGYDYKDNLTNPVGHSYSTTVVKPTAHRQPVQSGEQRRFYRRHRVDTG